MSGTGTKKLRAVLLASLMVLWVLAGTVAFAGGAAAGTLGNVEVTPGNTAAGAGNVAYTVQADADSDLDSNSINGIDINTDGAPVDFSSVEGSDIVRIGIDSDNDDTIETDISDDIDSVSQSNGGNTLEITLGGKYAASEGETVLLEVGGVTNPSSAGTYAIQNDISGTSQGSDTIDIGGGKACQVINTDTGETFGNDIQAAIDDAETNAGHTIALCDETYDQSVTVDKSVTITNKDGATPTVVAQDGTAFNVKADDVTIEGTPAGDRPLNIEGDGGVIVVRGVTGTTVSGVSITGDYPNTGSGNLGVDIRSGGSATVENVGFDSLYGGIITLSDGSTTDVNNIDVTQSTFGVGLQSAGSEVTNSDITADSQGISAAKGAVITGNTITVDKSVLSNVQVFEEGGQFGPERGIDVASSGAIIKDNHIDSTHTALLVGAGSDSLTVKNNDLLGDEFGLDASAYGGTVDAAENWWGSENGPSADSNTYNVDNQGAEVVGDVTIAPWLDAAKDDSPSAFAPVTTEGGATEASVQAGIDSANAKGTVSLKPGEFSEAVEVDKDITLTRDESIDWSANTDPTIRFAPASVDGTATVDIVASGVEVESLIVERALNDRDQSSPYAQGIAVRASDARIHNTIVQSEQPSSGNIDNTVGIAVLDNSPASNVTVSGDVFGDDFASGVSGYQTGIMVSEYYSNTISDVDIDGTRVAQNRDGVVVKSHNNDNAVSDVSVTGSLITDNSRNGLAVFSGSTFQGSQLVAQAGDTVSVDTTDIVDNGDGVLNEGSETLDATNNYWGAENGPSGQGTGDGDSVSEDVDFDPFLEQTNFAGSGDVSLTADPDEADDGSSTHTLTYTVTSDSSVAGEDLEDVQLDYSNVADDGGGSTSSVSDTSNAEVRILESNGDVQNEITSPSTVESSSNVVTVGVSGANGDRTLQEGDEIEVTIQPVSNPSEGDYTVPVTVDSVGDATDEADATLDIGQEDDTGDDDSDDEETDSDDEDDSFSGGGNIGGGGAPSDDDDDSDDDSDDTDDNETDEEVDVPAENVSETDTVNITDDDPDSPGVTVTTNNTSVSSITFENETVVENATNGTNATEPANVTVNEVDAPPEEAGSPPGQTVRTVEIEVPEEAEDSSATFEVTVDREDVEALNASEDELTVTRYNDSAGEWEELNTSVAESGNESVTLEAETPGFSFFAVTAQDDETDSTPTPTETTPTESTPTPTDMPTETATETDATDDMTTDEPTETASEDQPGFGAIVALVALLAAALLAARRQQ